MSEYPRLTAMGVIHPEQISRYSVSSMEHTDYLLIMYKRPLGSFLPISRTYEFPRVQKTGKDPATGKEQTWMVSQPEFREAEKELKALLSDITSRKATAEAMLEELHRLEEEVGLHASALRDLIKEMEND